jgi:hypothetical protein
VIDDIAVNVERVDDRIVFSFPDGPISFLTLVVTDLHGEELWTVHPIGMGGEQVGPAGAFVAVEVTSAEASAGFLGILDLLHRGGERVPFTLCKEVEYGSPPAGYAETSPAKPLQRDASYSIIVLNPRASGAKEFVA